MIATFEEITQKAVHLPSHQRLALAAFLLEMDDSSGNPQVDQAWEEEIQNRIRAIDSGTVVGIPYQDVMREAEQRLAP